MAKRTWARRQFSDDKIREALKAAGGNVTHAAAALGVNRSTLGRWLRADPQLRPSPRQRPAESAHVQPSPDQSPEQWRDAILARYELSHTEMVLLDLAVQCLGMSRDLLLRPSDRLAASARFQSLIRQLNFPTEDHNEDEAEAVEPEETGNSNIFPIR